MDKPSMPAVREVLRRRGHHKLARRILAEYEKLQVHRERSERQSAVTPERERTRVLLELYKKLTQN